MNEQELEQHIAEGLVSKRKHPTLPLYILNYTAAVQFAWTWNDVTLNCRGLVVDENNRIIARSFPKFFSYEQLDGKLPEGEFVVEEKMDGSMLLAFYYGNQLVTATRGSFESEQAIKGREFIESLDLVKAGQCICGGTMVFEIIYKENRIVVDYDYEGLVLLSEVWEDGHEVDSDFLDRWALRLGVRRPKIYSFNSLEEIVNYNEENIEGFVLRYASGERVKIKTDDYKRLHRLITGVSEKTVWEALKDNKFNELIENVPDEFYDWVHQVKADLDAKYEDILYAALEDFRPIAHLKNDRKAFALEAQKTRYPAILFKALDGKDFYELIWKMVRPEVTQVFKMVSESSN